MFCSLLSKSTTEKNPIDPKRACDDKFSKVTYKGDLYSEADICKKTWQNKHRGLEGIRKREKVADWHNMAGRKKISFDHTGLQRGQRALLSLVGNMVCFKKTEGK